MFGKFVSEIQDQFLYFFENLGVVSKNIEKLY